MRELFPILRTRRESEALRLNAEQVRSFEANGYLAGIRILEGAALDAVREAVERIRRGETPHLDRLYEVEEDYYRAPERNAFHCLGGWLVEAALHDLVSHPGATVPAAQLLGLERLRFWHDQVFYKPPRHPGVVAWHQDFSYWTRTLPMNHITINIVLDDTPPGNGCLHYAPGSHRWPLLAPVSFGQDMEAFRDFLPPELREGFRPTPVALKAGEASFHRPLTVHGSSGAPWSSTTWGPTRAPPMGGSPSSKERRSSPGARWWKESTSRSSSIWAPSRSSAPRYNRPAWPRSPLARPKLRKQEHLRRASTPPCSRPASVSTGCARSRASPIAS